MLACRICRIPMEAPQGCQICNPIRNNLIAVGENEEDKPSLAGVAQEVVSDIKLRLKLIRAEEPTVDNERRLLGLANTAAKVLESARKLQADGIDAVAAMSFTERTDLFLTWYTNLPPAYRGSVREKLAEYEVDIAKPVEQETKESQN